MANEISSPYERLTWPYLSPPREHVRKEYFARIKNRNFTFVGKTPFMRMTSGLKLKTSSEDSGLRAVLDPLNSVSERYTVSSGFKPKGGVTSVSVRYRNDIGTIRAADIKWQVYTKKEFDTLDEFFMNPGKLVLLEWGWADGAKSLLSSKEVDNLRESTFEKIRRQRIIDSHCNYDAMLGMITNFDWDYNDGKYECTTILTSPGAFFGDLNIDYSAVPIPTSTGQIRDTYSTIKEAINLYMKDKDWLKKNFPDDKNFVEFEKSGNKYIRFAALEALVNFYHPVSSVFSGDVYISCPMTKRAGNDKVVFYSTSPEIALWDTNGTTGVMQKFSDESGRGFLKNIYVNVDCVVEVFNNSSTLNQAFSNLYSKLQAAGTNAWRFRMIVRSLTDTDISALDSDNHFKEFYKIDNPSEISTTVDDKFTYNAIDSDVLRNKVISFDTLGGNSMITNINVNSKMSGAVVMSMVAASNSNFTLLSGFPTFVSLRQNTNVAASQDTFADVSRERTISRIAAAADRYNQEQHGGTKQNPNKVETYVEQHPGWLEARIVAQSSEQQKMLISDQGSLSVLLPIDLTVTMFGLSGFYPGNVITADVIPEAYKDNAFFQIIGITDVIDTNGWKTEISAKFRNISKKSSTEFPLTEDSKVEINDKTVRDSIAAKGNPDDLQNDCFGKYKIADLNMNRFGGTNEITEDVRKNLSFLCKEFLQPLNFFLKPMNLDMSIISAFRSNEINTRYDEPVDEMHTFGSAVDIKIRDLNTGSYLSPQAVALLIDSLGLSYDIIVVEDFWLHVAYVNEKAAGRKNRNLKYKIQDGTRTPTQVSTF